MALRDMIQKELDAKKLAANDEQAFQTVLAEGVERGIIAQAEKLYDGICQNLTSLVADGQRSEIEGYIEVPNGFLINIPYREVKVPETLASEFGLTAHLPQYSYDGKRTTDGAFGIRLYWIEYVEGFSGRKCRLQFFYRTVWEKLLVHLKRMCDEDGIMLGEICLAEMNGKGKGYTAHSIDSTYKVKWHPELGGGWPVYKSFVILPFSYTYRQ